MSTSDLNNSTAGSHNKIALVPNIADLRWTASPNVRVASRFAAPAPGVYAFGRVRRLAGLPYAIEWVYIGRSTTGGLRGRLRSHRPLQEANPRLAKWLERHHADAEVWFAPTASAAEAVVVEEHLIYQLNPPFNTIGTPKGGAK